MTEPNPRDLPADMARRLIVAVDVPTIAQAERLIADLDGAASFFKLGLWLAFADGFDGLLKRLLDGGKQVFLDAKMHDIGKTVEEGVARAADRGVTFITVHGEPQVIESAMKGRRGTDARILAVTVLTSLGDAELRELGYGLTAEALVHRRVRQAVQYGCDGIVASASDNPDTLRGIGGSDRLLIVTPGIRGPEDPVDDHRRSADAATAIAQGADYLVVGRPIVAHADPAERARRIVAEMNAGAQRRAAR